MLWVGNCCLRHSFSPVLEPRQGGDICSLAGLTFFSNNNVLLAALAWGTPSAWHHVPRVFIQALPVHSLPTIAHYTVLCLYCVP